MCATDKIADEVPTFCPNAGPGLPPKQRNRLGQLYQLRQKHRLAPPPQTPEPATPAATTALADYFRNFSHGKILVKVISVSSILIVLCSLIAKILSEPQLERSKTWTLFYLSSFAIHFGSQVWMTMVSGLVLYFTLPRHVFGSVQEKLFPAFYTFSTFVSFVQIISFINTQIEINLWSRNFVQVLCMLLTFSIELFIQLYVAKPIVMLKHIKTQMEASVGCGQEIGKHVLGELANCPHYMKILGRFRRLHSYTAIATIVTVVCSVYHLNYLAERICI